jgi:glycosyltransferase involved in cell wall biosynthesis
VIPAFDEERRIAPTIAALQREAGVDEILVVDDGSADGTVALCRELGVRVIACGENRGKGHAVRVGMLAARGDVRVMADADGSTPAHQLGKLLAAIHAGADVAIGSRYLGAAKTGQPLWRRAWSRLANQVVQARLLPGIVDPHCGFKAFTAGAAETLFARSRLDGWAFDLEVLAFARLVGLHISEVAVEWHDDRDSRVKLAHLPRVLAEVAALEARINEARPSTRRAA